MTALVLPAAEEPVWVHEATARRLRRRQKRVDNASQEARSARLLEKEPAVRVSMTARATRLKELKDTIASCSKKLRGTVGRLKILDHADRVPLDDFKVVALAACLRGKCGGWAGAK